MKSKISSSDLFLHTLGGWKMNFGSSVVYAAKSGKDEFEEVPESKYNHVVTGYSSGGAAGYDDDGEVPI